MSDFRTLPAGQWQQTLIVQKSRFVAFAARVDSVTAAQAFLKSVALPDATHHCYAYLTADGQKSNDNGEPAGTAGLPILQAIESAGLSHVAVAVERYFGGVKLGTGGLARAYGQAASQVLTAIKPVVVRDCVVLGFNSSYDQQNAIHQLVQKHGGLCTVTYQACVVWQVSLPQDKQTVFARELGEVMRMVPAIKIVTAHTGVEFPD